MSTPYRSDLSVTFRIVIPRKGETPSNPCSSLSRITGEWADQKIA